MFAILASHPFQSNLDVKSTLQVVVAGPLVAKTKADMPTINAKRNIASLRKESKEDANGKATWKKSAISAIRTSVILECPLSGAQKKNEKIFWFLLYPK